MSKNAFILFAVLAVLAVLGAAPSATAVTNIVNVNICDAEWTAVEALPRFADRVSRWQALAPKCARSGLYEARLATLETLFGRYDEAREAVRAGLALDSPYKKELLSTMAGVALNQGQLADAQKQYQALITSYPNYYDGYCGIGAIMLIERKFPEAVRYLNEAAQYAQAPIIYRHLTIAYHQLHQNQQAVDAFDKAYRLNHDIVRDKDATHAVTRALMFLGNYRAADGAVKLLLEANPAAGADPQIQQTQQIIREKLEEATPK
jgi:tetratricopeptide (TPR) repeat protein